MLDDDDVIAKTSYHFFCNEFNHTSAKTTRDKLNLKNLSGTFSGVKILKPSFTGSISLRNARVPAPGYTNSLLAA